MRVLAGTNKRIRTHQVTTQVDTKCPAVTKTIQETFAEAIETLNTRFSSCFGRFNEFCKGKDKFLAAGFKDKKDMVTRFLVRHGFEKVSFKGNLASFSYDGKTIHVMGKTDLEALTGIFDAAFRRLEKEIL